METRSTSCTGISISRKCLRWLPLAAIAAVVLGCASTGNSQREPTPREDFQEYRRIVVQSMSQVGSTLRALDEISVQADRNPRKAYEVFAKAVHQLEVGSIKVRAHTQAMRARGDAYFEHWEESLAHAKSEQVRKLAEEHRPQLRQSFEEARLASQQVRETFRPFLSDLQKLRAVLEADPSLAHIASEKSLILAAKDKGRQVQQGLDRLLAEMNWMQAILRPPDAAPGH